MALIEINSDNIDAGIWWIKWVDTNEVIGRILQNPSGRCEIAPQGPHWSPMKSFGGQSFDTKEDALEEVRLYFYGR